MGTEQSVTDQLTVGVQVVENDVSVAFVTGSKHDYLAEFGEFLQKLSSVGSYIDACINFFACRELDFKCDIMGKTEVIVTVDECLV